MTLDLFMASAVLLQDPQGVVGPLTFTVELHTPGQAVIFHLDGRQVQGEIQDEVVGKKKKKWTRSKVLYCTHFRSSLQDSSGCIF